ncbi:MAG: ATP-binding protein [Caldilineaceae bacterium]
MNHLWARLTLGFMLITLLTVGTISWLADRRADAEFRAYLLQPGAAARNAVIDQLSDYYRRQQSWAGVEQFADSVIGTIRRRRWMGMLMGGGQPILADQSGTVLYDPSGERLRGVISSAEQQAAQPIVVDGKTVGYLLLPSGMNMMLGRAEQNFLNQLRRWLIFATLGVGMLGILLGLAVSRTLASPLAALATAARGLAKRDWSQRVALEQGSSIIEIAEVAHAFNEMAESLEKSEVQRRNLMADVAHELRTPITVLQGNLRAMLDGVYPLELNEIATLYDETRLLSRLVDDLRELALAEAGQISLTLQTVDVNSLLKAAANKFSPVAEAQQIRFAAHPSSALPTVAADPDRLMQVIHNLVTNALRHTPAGGRIELAAEANAERVLVTVSDTGEGIPSEELPHIFDRFYRTDKSRTRRSGGSGLGLTIAKTLVESMGGQIGAESTPGQGSRFWFTLPVREEGKTKRPEDQKPG